MRKAWRLRKMGRVTEMTSNSPAVGVPVTENSPASKSVYPPIWRWHFYAGLFMTPFVFILAVTGALWVFQNEILDLTQGEMRRVKTGAAEVPIQQQIDAALAVNPGATLDAFSLRPPGYASNITLQPPRLKDGQDGHLSTYVDPFTGKYLGSDDGRFFPKFFDTVIEIHTTLLAGQGGRLFIELVNGWFLILLVTGLYLWWPRGADPKIWGVWLPRLRSGKRLFWRDLHTVPGFYLLSGALLIALTGLFFCLVWGISYMKLAEKSGALPKSYLSPPKSDLAAPKAETPPTIDSVIALARREGFRAPLYIAPPAGEAAVWAAYSFPETPPLRAGVLWVDAHTGKTIDLLRPSDASMMANLMLLAYAIHTGAIFGLPTKIIAFLICLGIVLLIITGIWMWWRRRPAGRTGFPKKVERRLGWLVIASIVLIGIFLPVTGVSILVILLGGWLWKLGKIVWKAIFRRRAAS